MKQLLRTLKGLVLPLALWSLFSPFSATGQTADRRTSIGFNGNVLQYQGDYGSDYWKFDQNKYSPGLAINQYLTRGLDLNTQVFYGELTGHRNAASYFTTTIINANLGLKLKLNNGWALKEDAVIQPYLLAASGWTFASRAGMVDTVSIEENKNYVDLQAGAGISLRLGGGVSLFVQSSQHLPLRANLDGATEAATPRWDDRFLQHTAGLTFNLGQTADEDEDGVADRHDRCPNTPSDLEVDEKGCPFDDDQDGVPNHEDQCPDQAGKPEMRGCPDADNDGVDDTDDACPDEPGKPELRGCPDTDNDGITDQSDNCLDTPAGATVDANGCTVALPASAPATADTDGDGVPNTEDRCPDRSGPAANHGCPEVDAAVRRRLQEATKLIGFERNKAILLPSSYPTLDTITKLLGEYPDYSLSIAGHTDSQGPAAFNLRLSRERAAAARRYMLEKGVAEARVEVRGYGPRHPLAPNTTEAGRAQNRRVEFDLFLTSDPNAAQVKYGAEPTTPLPAAPTKAKKSAPVRKSPTKAPARRKALVPKKRVPAKAVKGASLAPYRTKAAGKSVKPIKRTAPAPKQKKP